MDETMAEGAPHPPQLIIGGMILLSAPPDCLSKLKPTTEQVFVNSLLSLMVSLVLMLLPQQTTAKKSDSI